MEISIFLAKVIGIYLVIDGLSAITMHKELIPVVAEIKNKTFFVGWGVFATIIGLLIVVSHSYWATLYQTGISLIGWFVLVKGILILFLPVRFLEEIILKLNKPIFYQIGGLFSILIGLWLTYFGFVV
ncbi:hypothetical protein GW764_03650 [Candidatus Parcubacteria bacterium]|nr:hypothetical protein [Candidatus Parcubacteria bacterium]